MSYFHSHTTKTTPNRHPSANAWNNLNTIAKVLTQKGALEDPRTALNTTDLAKEANLDRAHMLRLITDRPGFVKVVSIFRGKRSQGYYYLADFLQAARAEFEHNYYPFKTPYNKDGWPSEVVLTEMVEEPATLTPELKAEMAQVEAITESVTARAEIKYSGKRPTQAPVLIDAIEMTPDAVEGFLRALNRMGDNLTLAFSETIQAIVEGRKCQNLDTPMVNLISGYIWLRDRAAKDPEARLVLSQIVAKLKAEREEA